MLLYWSRWTQWKHLYTISRAMATTRAAASICLATDWSFSSHFPRPLHLMFISPPAGQEPMRSMYLTTITILNDITNFMIILYIHDLYLTIFPNHACICPHNLLKSISPRQMGKLVEIARQLPTLERKRMWLPSDQDTSSRKRTRKRRRVPAVPTAEPPSVTCGVGPPTSVDNHSPPST